MALYATLADVQNLGVPPQAIQSLTAAQQTADLQAASDLADSFFRARWGMTAVPLVAWDTSVTLAAARIAAYLMVSVRGFRSNATADQTLREWYRDALDWLGKVQRQQAHPSVTLANASAPGSVQPNLSTTSLVGVLTGTFATNRGW